MREEWITGQWSRRYLPKLQRSIRLSARWRDRRVNLPASQRTAI